MAADTTTADMTTADMMTADMREYDSYADFYRNSAYGAFPQIHMDGGTYGAHIVEAEQSAIDMVDPPFGELIIQCSCTEVGAIGLDAGDGLSRSQAGPGRITIAPLNTSIRYVIDYPHTGLFLAIPGDRLQDALDQYGLTDAAFDPLVGRMTENPEAYALMRRLRLSTADRSGAGSLLFDSILLQLFAALVGKTLEPVDGHPRSDGSRKDYRIARAIDYIEAYINEPLSVGSLAGIACLSPAQFSRCFKKATGLSVWRYVQQRRCERAKDFLLHSDASISEIAWRCGFSSPSHLATSFRDIFGAPPSAIRNQA